MGEITHMGGHTPEPWFSDVADEVCATLEGGAVIVIAVLNPLGELNHRTATANGYLIAAAPELLEALQYVLSAHGEQLTDAFDQARKAVLKATPQSEGAEG